MKYFYSKTTNGLYSDNYTYPNPPGDLIEITEDARNSLIAGIGAGKRLASDESGNPVLLEPLEESDLTSAKAAKISILSAECQAYLLAGFTSSALGSVHAYPSQLTDQQNQASVSASGVGGSLWCETGSVWGFVAHTDEQATQVVADWKTYLNAAQAKLQTLAASVNAATTVAATQAINW